MLTSFRKGSHSLPAKLLLVFLIATFALWGVGDMFIGSPEDTIATVAGEPISSRELEHTLRQMQAQFPELTPQVAQNLTVRLQVLQRLINDRLLTLEAAALGINFSEDALSTRIADDPVFHDNNGRFSRGKFLRILQQSNLTQGAFMQRYESDLRVMLLHAAISRSVTLSPELARLYYHIQHETRRAKLILFSTKDAPKPEEPAIEELEALYTQVQEQFREPEYRSYRYISFNSDMIAKSLGTQLSEQAIREHYDTNASSYLDSDGQQMPFSEAKSAIEQLLGEQIATDKLMQLSGQLDDAIAEGSSLEEALKAADLTHLKVETVGPIAASGAFKNGELYEMAPIEEEVLQAAFEQDAGEISPITISADHYYYLVETLDVAASFIPEFASVEDELRAMEMDERLRRALQDKAETLASELQGAENPFSAAKERGLKLVDSGILSRSTASIKRKGASDIPLSRAFMQQLFQLRPNEVSSAVSLGDGRSALIILSDISEAKAPSSSDLAPIQNQLTQQFGEQALDIYLGALREKYGVEIMLDKIAVNAESVL